MAVEVVSSGGCVDGGVVGAYAPILAGTLLGGDGLGKASTIQSIYSDVHEQANAVQNTSTAIQQKRRKHKKKTGNGTSTGIWVGVGLAVLGFLGLLEQGI